MDNNKCPKCGIKLPEGSLFCNKCGYKILRDNHHHVNTIE